MRILLDENLDPKLIPFFKSSVISIEPKTVKEMGWLGVKNGELLRLAVENKFDAFISMDKNIKHQQNITKLGITVFILRAFDNKFTTVAKLVPKLISKLEENHPHSVIEIE